MQQGADERLVVDLPVFASHVYEGSRLAHGFPP
jgi:hypothetical protein